MQLNITGNNVEITEALRDFVNTKFAKLEQYFDRINQVYIVLKVEKVTHISDATLHVLCSSTSLEITSKSLKPFAIL